MRLDFGLPMSVMFRSMEPVGQSFDAQLRALDIDPGDVKRVGMTHLHVDHTSGMRLLPSAEFTCAGAEWQAAGRRGAVDKGYVRHHLPLLTDDDGAALRSLDEIRAFAAAEPEAILVPSHDPEAWHGVPASV